MDYHYTEILKYKYERCAGAYNVKEYEFKIRKMFSGQAQWYIYAVSNDTILDLLQFYNFKLYDTSAYEWKYTSFILDHDDLIKLINILNE